MYWSIIEIKNQFRANKNDFWHIRLLHKMAKDIVNQNTDEMKKQTAEAQPILLLKLFDFFIVKRSIFTSHFHKKYSIDKSNLYPCRNCLSFLQNFVGYH